jgi:hypothetical protein
MSKYAVFSETNFEELETWYTFINMDGNEDELRSLKQILDGIDWGEAPDWASAFALDISGVSATTAKQMCMVDLDLWYYHSKFDGKMKKIVFRFGRRMSEEDKAVEVYNRLGGNHIADFLSEEDLDGCELNDDDSRHSDSDRSDTDDDAYSYSSSESPPQARLDETKLPSVLRDQASTDDKASTDQAKSVDASQPKQTRQTKQNKARNKKKKKAKKKKR